MKKGAAAAHPHRSVRGSRRKQPAVRRKAYVRHSGAVTTVRVQARALPQVMQNEAAVGRARGQELAEGVEIQCQAGKFMPRKGMYVCVCRGLSTLRVYPAVFTTLIAKSSSATGQYHGHQGETA